MTTKNPNYLDVFANARVMLNDELTNFFRTLREYKKINHQCSIAYLKIGADCLTAYNELSPTSFFVSSKIYD